MHTRQGVAEPALSQDSARPSSTYMAAAQCHEAFLLATEAEAAKIKEAVLHASPTARFAVWGGRYDLAGWVFGPGWETKICANEDRAWRAAAELLGVGPAVRS